MNLSHNWAYLWTRYCNSHALSYVSTHTKSHRNVDKVGFVFEQGCTWFYASGWAGLPVYWWPSLQKHCQCLISVFCHVTSIWDYFILANGLMVLVSTVSFVLYPLFLFRPSCLARFLEFEVLSRKRWSSYYICVIVLNVQWTDY